jgi:prepilin signal peptidase PulO-like enzyme (type II secretory pathway)
MYSVALFILGMIVGSFINALAHRIKNDRPFILGRSFCPHCEHKLSWWQLVPVAGYLFLRGKCHYCGKAISYHYPIVEIFTGASFALLLWVNQGLLLSPIILTLSLLCVAVLVFIVLYDWQEFLILDMAVLIGLVAAAILSSFKGAFLQGMFSAAALTAVFGTIYYVSKGKWMGLGDVKLAAFLGFLNGSLTFLVLFFASWAGAVIGLVILAAGKGTLKSKLPFGSLLGVASITVLIFEKPLSDFVARLFA